LPSPLATLRQRACEKPETAASVNACPRLLTFEAVLARM
jgi:hypothetical protein